MVGAAGKAGKPNLAAHDRVTVLKAVDDYSASKRFVKTDQGIEKTDYNAGYLFHVAEPIGVSSIDDLSTLLSLLEGQPKMLIIRGEPLSLAVIGTWQRRKGDGQGAAFKPTPRRWALIDFDKIPLPRGLTLKRDVNSIARVCEFLVSKLPPEFHGVSYHWQLSSSAGLGDQKVVSMHLWFWLTEPVADKDIKTWANWWNERVGSRLVDVRLFQCVQPHYTAAPEFEGLADPFPERSGLVTKALGCVDLVLPAIEVRRPRQTSGNGLAQSNATGFEARLAMIGDHPGGEGFHGPIVAAVASYVATHGEQGTDREALYVAVSQRVFSADASKHDPAYVEHMASREHIGSAIDSALRKFGATPKVHDDCPAHYASSPISINEATRRLDQIAKLIG